jgi:hypothetical protein
MHACLLVFVALLALAGCSRATLPYRPEPQPPGARLSASYEIVGDRVRIEIDTDGRPLEQVWIMRRPGAHVAPETVGAPSVVTNLGPAFSIGLGVGTWEDSGNAASGLGISIPVGGGSSPGAATTIAWFKLDAVGPPPWQLYVKLGGTVPTTFPVGGPPARS